MFLDRCIRFVFSCSDFPRSKSSFHVLACRIKEHWKKQGTKSHVSGRYFFLEVISSFRIFGALFWMKSASQSFPCARRSAIIKQTMAPKQTAARRPSSSRHGSHESAADIEAIMPEQHAVLAAAAARKAGKEPVTPRAGIAKKSATKTGTKTFVFKKLATVLGNETLLYH